MKPTGGCSENENWNPHYIDKSLKTLLCLNHTQSLGLTFNLIEAPMIESLKMTLKKNKNWKLFEGLKFTETYMHICVRNEWSQCCRETPDFSVNMRVLRNWNMWPIYCYKIRYELQAIRLARIKEMALENGKSDDDKNACEVEMAETKSSAKLPPPSP